MMEISNIQLLLLVNFLYSTCQGLVLPVLSPHIMELGGNHVISGLLVSGGSACQMLSKDFVALFEHGKKFIISFSVFVAFVCNLILAITESYWMILLSRFAWALVSQVDNNSKEFAKLTEPTDDHIKLLNLIEIMKTAGIVVGAIAGGYIYDCGDDFQLNAMLAAVLSLTSVLLLQCIDRDPPGEKIRSNMKKIPQVCSKQLVNLTRVNYKDNWDVFALKTAYVSSFTVYFAKYAKLVRYNYNVGTIVVGYTVAYQNMLIFASSCSVPYLKHCLGLKFHPKEVFEHSLVLCAGFLMAIYYAPSYDCYLFFFIPLILMYTLVNCFFEDDALHLEDQRDVSDAIRAISTIINVFVPFVFGVALHFLGSHAFKIISCLPTIVCMYVINQRFIAVKMEEIEEEHGHQE